MHGSSSELLLDQQQDLLRRKKLLELSGRNVEPPPVRRTCMQRLKFYATSVLAMAVSGGSAALLFLVPLYVDPAVSTLMADFETTPVTCETVQVHWFVGLQNCTWSSCREGCTSDLYRCTHITVSYRPFSPKNETLEEQEATLLVNIKGCGYPPQVQCNAFLRLYAKEGNHFPCHYSKTNVSLVLPVYSRAEHVTTIANFFVAPFIVTLVASLGLCVLHCDCRCSSNRRHAEDDSAEAARAKKRRRKAPHGSQIEDASEVTISRVDTMTPRGDDDDDEEELTVSSFGRPL